MVQVLIPDRREPCGQTVSNTELARSFMQTYLYWIIEDSIAQFSLQEGGRHKSTRCSSRTISTLLLPSPRDYSDNFLRFDMSSVSTPRDASQSKTRSSFAKRMVLLSNIIMPKPKVGANGPHIAYILKKDRHSKQKSGASRISAERRYVQGLGYIRADATPVRSRSAKSAASGRSSYLAVPIKAI
ncbi:hypothetical protein OPQ81_008317 [Rhizoctonia solani]|nr:hypothetical protein OPQ81_008317 [Rhizoctonia solani]